MTKSKTPAKAPAKKTAKRKPAEALTPEQRARRERQKRWLAWSTAPGAIEELCDFVVNNGAEGHLAAFCRELGFPYMTVSGWLRADAVRARAYEEARYVRADVLADELLQVAAEKPSMTLQGSVDSAAVQDKRVRIDALKWAAGKLDPRRYGDKLAVGGAEDLPPVQTQLSGEVSLSPSEAYRKLIRGG